MNEIAMPIFPLETVGLSVLGILVSILLFLIGYRKTVGAKRERINSANLEIEKILIRRIVQESFKPSANDISRLIEGKARDHRVKSGSLYSVAQVLNSIYTRIVETDFLPQGQREQILSIVLPIMQDVESRGYEHPNLDITLDRESQTKSFSDSHPTLILGFVAAAIGSTVAIAPQIADFSLSDAELLRTMAIAMGLSSVAILGAFQILKAKDAQGEASISSSSSALEKQIKFERSVAKTLLDSKLQFVPAGPSDRGYDFVVTTNDDRKLLILSKMWTGQRPMQFTRKVASNLSLEVHQQGATEGIIVTKDEILPIKMARLDDKIRIMTLKEFRAYVRNDFK